jgi:predicted RNA binding protein YcfA (HicA-like mRNA interferase family)
MPKLKPVKWRELISQMKVFGFDGPFRGGKHFFMAKDSLVLTIPNPHAKPISPDLLLRILKQTSISRKEWLENVHKKRAKGI